MVNQLLLQPQEIEVFYILPTIRKYMSMYMKEQGMSQKHIAELLCIRESTVSQYISEKRAAQVSFNKEIREQIGHACARITNRATFIHETQKLLEMIRHQNVLCQIHRKLAGLPLTCTLDKMGCK